ncbi:PH domain-containing protein [Actinomadura rudentiformis]|uniref:PH domain-containing protein n=1 Tax=Actinomadura rudentiformis TaxID=359158 RepID=A0A6H9YWU0_9ACTN|nr:PH domain-containing protein [Actinomadura rudentiformis]KAB2350675.1 PH domain-containing protein [Actinomadura rudentiformis]
MSAKDAATYPRTLRCWRFLGLLVGVTAFCGLTTTLLVSGATSSRSNPSDLSRAILSGLFFVLTAVCVMFLIRTRVVIEESGVGVVWGFHRRHLAWDEIIEITADSAGIGAGWFLHVRTAEREHAAVAFPTTRGKSPEPGTRLYEPSGDEPYGLYKLHAELWEEWQSRIA